MQSSNLSFDFKLPMLMVSGIFSILDIIPFVNGITNFIYTLILIAVFMRKYWPLIQEIKKAGASIGFLAVKIVLINGIADILDYIPFVSIIPWSFMAMRWTNKMIEKQIEQVKKLLTKLKDAYQSDVRTPVQARWKESYQRRYGVKADGPPKEEENFASRRKDYGNVSAGSYRQPAVEA